MKGFVIRCANWLLRRLLARNYDIQGQIPLDALDLPHAEAHEHAATNDYFDLLCILARLGVAEKSIVDLGCGSGAAIAAFRLLPYRTIYGVELSPRLAAIAACNFSRSTRIKILQNDARLFRERVDIVYMFNPFPPHVVNACLRTLLDVNKKITVIYRNPRFIEDVKQTFANEFRQIRSLVSSTSTYAIFELHTR